MNVFFFLVGIWLRKESTIHHPRPTTHQFSPTNFTTLNILRPTNFFFTHHPPHFFEGGKSGLPIPTRVFFITVLVHFIFPNVFGGRNNINIHFKKLNLRNVVMFVIFLIFLGGMGTYKGDPSGGYYVGNLDW